MATIVASGVGFLLAGPAGRVREFYLAMMSLGFGLIVYELARELRGVTGGVMGMRGIPVPADRHAADLRLEHRYGGVFPHPAGGAAGGQC